MWAGMTLWAPSGKNKTNHIHHQKYSEIVFSLIILRKYVALYLPYFIFRFQVALEKHLSHRSFFLNKWVKFSFLYVFYMILKTISVPFSENREPLLWDTLVWTHWIENKTRNFSLCVCNFRFFQIFHLYRWILKVRYFILSKVKFHCFKQNNCAFLIYLFFRIVYFILNELKTHFNSKMEENVCVMERKLFL